MQEAIIQFLKEKSGYVSGEEISRQLGISRAGIWKYVEDFRRQGYRIEALPRKGYRILSSPDQLLPWEIKYGLGTKGIGQNIVYEKSVESTMDEAVRLGLAGALAGTVVCAETQKKGRGRMGRLWVSPPGKGIYASLILRPRVPLAQVAQLTLVSAVAVCEALRKASGLNAMIKWPNDILINGKKVVGILTELNAEMDRVRFVVVGLGINVNTPVSQLPLEATSLKIEAKRDFSRVSVFQDVLRSFEKWLVIFESEGFQAVRLRWKDLSATLGKKVKFVEPRGETLGIAFDLALDGSLLIRNDNGETIKKHSGDIIH